VSVGIERWAGELAPPGAGGAAGGGNGEALRARLAVWEDLLTLVVDPESGRVRERDRTRGLLSFLLERAGIDEAAFWRLPRARRGREFLSRYSRASRSIPRLEITSFDLDKLLKERFRHEPLTLGAAWHHGLWRSYFSHAAITHPANDGLREEFSTAWDITRKHPAVLFRAEDGARHTPLSVVRLDLPMLVGPLPYTDGVTMERAYLDAIAAADPAGDVKTASLLVLPAEQYARHAPAFADHLPSIVLRLTARDLDALAAGRGEGALLAAALRAGRVAEIAADGGADLERLAAAALAANPGLLLSIFLRNGPGFWGALERAARHEAVAMIHVHSGSELSYRFTPRVDAHLKARFLRARVQLVSAGGDGDAQASAAAVFESVLLGANGGSMTDVAGLALLPALADVYHGADPAPALASLAGRDPKEMRDLAISTLTCWQHSILDFLSCMGIDDVQKTSGNTMAVTITEDWVREVDRLATAEFGERNAELNARRVAAEPPPRSVRERYRVSSLLGEVEPDLPLVRAARILAHENANYHLMNTNRNLGADFLEVIYRMAAGEPPRVEDFFVEGDMGPLSLDGIGVRLSRASIGRAIERLRENPTLLDYISLAVPRGFLRPGAVAPRAQASLHAAPDGPAIATFEADAFGGFEAALPAGHAVERALASAAPLWLRARGPEGEAAVVELTARDHGGLGASVARASRDGAVVVRHDPRGGTVVRGFGFREPVWHGPVSHASISLGAASEDFLIARIEGNAGLAMTSSGEGGPIRLAGDEEMKWESLQAASGHFGILASDLRRVRDVEIKINQGAKPGKGGRLAGAKVTATVSKARNIPIGTDALSPDPKHDIYSIEDMPAEVWLWLLYRNHVGIKITGSNYTKYVAAGMWSNFVVDYLLIDSGLGGSGNYHADSSHVGWPDIFRTILHTHHALVSEKVDLDGSGTLRTIRDLNGAAFGAGGGTRLFASGGLRGEIDMLKVLIAGADGLVEASIGKAVAFGCNQCGNCHLDCPRGGITTKAELTVQNERDLMRRRFRNWAALNMVKIAVLIDALNIEQGAIDGGGRVTDPARLIDDVRKLRGRTDLLVMPRHPEPAAPRVESEHDSCRVGSLVVTEPVSVRAIWEAARLSVNGGNNRGGGIDFAGFAPGPVSEKTCVVINTIGPDRADTMREMLGHLGGCRLFDAAGHEMTLDAARARLADLRVPVRERYAGEEGWRRAGLRENPGDFTMLFLEIRPEVLVRYGRALVASEHWLQRRTKYADLTDEALAAALESAGGAGRAPGPRAALTARLAEFARDVREEYFTALAHVLDTRYYRTHGPDDAPAGKFAAKRRGFVVSIGEDLAAIKMSGWTHTIPEYFDFDRFWARYPGAAEPTLRAHVWGMHHRYPTNSPAIDAEGRGNPAGAHPFKAYNVLLMHNGEQVGVDSTAPLLCEFGFVHADASMGAGAADYHGDSAYERKALTDTEYAAYLVDFTRRVLGLGTEEASQVISPITGLDLEAMDPERRARLRLLMTNYVQLTPTGPYKFTIVESRVRRGGPNGETARVVGFRENMDIKFLRPHEIAVSADTRPGGVRAVANGSEAKIADVMLRVLHEEGVLGDAGADLRFNMRPGGNPSRGDFGGVVEAFTERGRGEIDLRNRFGEPVAVERAGAKVDLGVPLDEAARRADPEWRRDVEARIEALAAAAARGPAAAVPPDAAAPAAGRAFGPDAPLPREAEEIVLAALANAPRLSFEDYRFLAERALPAFAEGGPLGEWTARRALALRVLAELRKRLVYQDLGGKSLASMEYLTDGGRAADGSAEGGVYRLLDAVRPLAEALAEGGPGAAHGVFARLTASTRDDLAPPSDAARDVLVIDFAGFVSESFRLDSASRILSEAVRLGWRNVVGYDFRGGPRYVGVNLAGADGAPARGVTIELFGREFGDFLGALLEGADVWVYGQGQSHLGMKADSGTLFVLQDALNTSMYAAHGGTVNVWDSGSRFAVAGQNKVYLEDGKTFAPGFKSIHFGSPNEYAFEYLMSGGENSLHVVLGLKKPGARGELSLKPKPYAGKFFMSGSAAGRVYVFDPERRLDPAQHRGNVEAEIAAEEWAGDVGPFIAREARRRGAPIRIEGESVAVRLDGAWRRWRFDEAFVKLVPIKVARALQKKGVTPPQLAQIVPE
jgi:glutamate synthase domain-containing protein 3/ferredoxin